MNRISNEHIVLNKKIKEGAIVILVCVIVLFFVIFNHDFIEKNSSSFKTGSKYASTLNPTLSISESKIECVKYAFSEEVDFYLDRVILSNACKETFLDLQNNRKVGNN